MMIVMKPTATEQDIQAVVERIESCGARAHLSRGEEVTLIGAIGDREHVQRLGLEGHAGVSEVVPILKPYKLSSTQFSGGQRTIIDVGGRRVALPGPLQGPALEIEPWEADRIVASFEGTLKLLAQRFPSSRVIVAYLPSPLACSRVTGLCATLRQSAG